MSSLQPYADLPPIEDEYGQFGTDTLLLPYNMAWPSMDLSLEDVNHPYRHSSKNLQHMQQQLNDLGSYATGYLPSLQIPPTFPGSDAWTDQLRHTRYASPGGPLGGTLSSTDSSPSEYALSPDISRQSTRLSVHSSYSYPPPDTATWAHPQLHGGYLPVSPSACAMKDILYRPDMYVDTNELAQMHITPIEDVVIDSSTHTPTGSDRGDSVGSEDHQASDNDPEYTPSSHARKSSSAKRSSNRPTIKPSPSAVIDINARVNKSAARGPSLRKTKQISPMSRKDQHLDKNFCCTFSHYGCESRFASKNEWKRHVASQHLQLDFYRCDVGTCRPDHGKGYNDFNRKDLFTQHMRRMHLPWTGKMENGSKRQQEEFERSLETIRQRCWHSRRAPPPRSCCGLCGLVFENSPDDEDGSSWEERMEHVGKHFEKQDWDAAAEKEDEDLTQWALEEGIVYDWGTRGKWLVGLEPSTRTSKRSAVRPVRDDTDEDDEEDAHGEVE